MFCREVRKLVSGLYVVVDGRVETAVWSSEMKVDGFSSVWDFRKKPRM